MHYRHLDLLKVDVLRARKGLDILARGFRNLIGADSTLLSFPSRNSIEYLYAGLKGPGTQALCQLVPNMCLGPQ